MPTSSSSLSSSSCSSSRQLGVAAVTTKWRLDLGEGQTVLDFRWWSHLSASHIDHAVLDRLPVLFVSTLHSRKNSI